MSLQRMACASPCQRAPLISGPNPKYFGQTRGVTWHNLLPNQFSGLNGIVVPGTLRDSPVLLALLLEQGTELEPMEVMTDTIAYSDAVMPGCGGLTRRPITARSTASAKAPSISR